MSYLDQTGRKNPASIAAVVGVHLAVGYALLVGLGYTVVPFVPKPTTIFNVPNTPPPPIRHEQPQRTKQPVTTPIEKQEDILKPLPVIVPPPPTIGDGVLVSPNGGGETGAIAPPQPPKANLASDAVPGRDRLRWITTDDYPTSLLRENVQGSVGISVTIGVDGRVRSCLVTQSSGNKQLDDTTCRLYTQRARFTPARDADGNPTIAQRSDRYRWQIPNE